MELGLTGVKVIIRTGMEKAIQRDTATNLSGVDESRRHFQDVASCLKIGFVDSARAESFVRQVS